MFHFVGPLNNEVPLALNVPSMKANGWSRSTIVTSNELSAPRFTPCAFLSLMFRRRSPVNVPARSTMLSLMFCTLDSLVKVSVRVALATV